MPSLRTSQRAAILAILGLGATLWTGCSDRSITGPSARPQLNLQDLRAALAAQRRYTGDLMRLPGVVGTAVGLLPSGEAAVKVLVVDANVHGLPNMLDGVPVATQVTGMLMAFSDPTKRQRPAPMGFSVGHPAITAGSIGARVVDPSGNVYVLSNNHVLANSNDATIGDAALQPGPSTAAPTRRIASARCSRSSRSTSRAATTPSTRRSPSPTATASITPPRPTTATGCRTARFTATRTATACLTTKRRSSAST